MYVTFHIWDDEEIELVLGMTFCFRLLFGEANMVFTVEPGIYLPEEGFGIRLEDDVVVQESGDPINLMQDIPIEADHIEELMNK